MRRIKRAIKRHFNCFPWLVVGIEILTDGNISRWQYFLAWVSVLTLIWIFCPAWNEREERRRQRSVDFADHKKMV